MKKKIAVSLISLDECFPKQGFSGGGHKVTQKLILGLVNSEMFEIDLFCQKGAKDAKIDGINSITILNKKNFQTEFKEKLKEVKYDYVLSSDVLLPFANNLVHSHSSAYKSKNGKNKFMQFILKFYNAKKIKRQDENLPKDKALFAVSEDVKNDYVTNYNLDKDKAFVVYPATDEEFDYIPQIAKKTFTVGSIVGGGVNKGGYMLLSALRHLPKDLPIKAKVIFPKMKKSFFFRFLVKFFGLNDKVEILPKQKDMGDFYKSIDCYILPSLNEAFGLVVTESALNFKPCIVSSTAGAKELITDNVNGFIFDRLHKPVKNLALKMEKVADLYLNDYEKYVEISQNAKKIVQDLNWQKFTDTIINNLISEE